MATQLLNKVQRECISTFAVGKGRKESIIIVSLEPGDLITFRLKGHKKTFTVSLHAVFNLALVFQSEIDYKEKFKDYQAKKKQGYKGLRKPKRTVLPYNKIYFKALNLL